MSRMTDEQRQYLQERCEGNGFYDTVQYSDWKEIKDEEFHTLLDRFFEARAQLAAYIGVNPDC